LKRYYSVNGNNAAILFNRALLFGLYSGNAEFAGVDNARVDLSARNSEMAKYSLYDSDAM